MSELSNDNKESIKLGGFPPIFKITVDLKKKREFKNENKDIDKNKLNVLNILNIKNILRK